ncbi:MAG: polysaccharide biosynthesis C-terminal domain-containing protein, partial [Rickettsiales bacterium]|nr:polysaccharide biosynthesis C-terminal domain-containing protein [Rickettsiales bacterium]
YYAERLNQFPLAIIGTALSTVLLPTLSKQVREKNQKAATNTQNKALEVALFFTLPCSFALALISDTLVSFLFERGNFTPEGSYKVARTLSALALGLPAFVMIKIFTPRYFAQYDTSTPVKFSFVCIILNIILALTLIPFLSYLGIAIATSSSAWINVALLYYFQRKRNMFLIDKKLPSQTIKIIFSCTLMIFTLILFEHFILNSATHNYIWLLFIGEITLGMIVYFVSSYCLKILDLSFLLKVKKTDG